jgi:hypothetical protein
LIGSLTAADVTYLIKNSTNAILYGHAYAVLAIFKITANNGTKIPTFMMRNPWGAFETI